MTILIKIAVLALLTKICKPYEYITQFSKNTVAHFDQFWDICPGFESNKSFIVRNVVIYGNRNNVHYDYEVELLQDAPKVSVLVEIERCSSREALDTCVKLTTLRSSNTCKLLLSENDFWSPNVKCVQPKLACFPKKGLYKGTDCHFNMTIFKWFPLTSKYYWKGKLLTFNKEDKTFYSCNLFGGKLRSIRE